MFVRWKGGKEKERGGRRRGKKMKAERDNAFPSSSFSSDICIYLYRGTSIERCSRREMFSIRRETWGWRKRKLVTRNQLASYYWPPYYCWVYQGCEKSKRSKVALLKFVRHVCVCVCVHLDNWTIQSMLEVDHISNVSTSLS